MLQLTYFIYYFIMYIIIFYLRQGLKMKKNIKILCLICILLTLLSSAAFAKSTYKIKYDYGVADIRSETIVNKNPKSFSSSDVIKLTAPECPGFEFKGWYSDSNYKNRVRSVNTSLTSDITLYAKWYEKSYNIKYVLKTPGIDISVDEVSNSNPLSRLASETTYLSDPVYTSDIYTFSGWYTDSDYKNKVSYIDEYTCNNVTLYAKWKNTSYSVHYELGEVADSVYPTENSNPSKYTYNKKVILSPASTSDPIYTFEGWYNDEFFTQNVTAIEKGTSGDIVLYAKWSKAEFNINYVLSDENNTNADKIHNNNPESHQSGAALTLNAPVSEDKKFKFDGWYTDSSFSEDSAISSIPATQYEDITIYAKWVKAVYEITYDFGEISLLHCSIDNDNPETYEYGDNKKLKDISADGFIFNGWCTDKNLKNKITAIPKDAYGDITIYADLTEKTYSINYVLEGNGMKASQVVNKNPAIRTTSEQISLVDAESINKEYIFAGWYLDKKYENDIEYIKGYSTGNITLYAKWIKNVTYIPCWGDATLSEQLSAADARLILRHASGLETGFTDIQKKVSDLNNDGFVRAADARLALRISAGLDKIEDIIAEYDLPEIKVEDGEIVFR